MRYFSFFVFLIVVMLYPGYLSAQQYRLSGVVSDTDRNNVEVVVVELLNADSTYIAHAVTDSTGFFTIQSPLERVILRASHLSYKTVVCDVDLSKTERLDIVLEKDENFINTAVVIGTRESLSYVDGNIVVSPSRLPGAEVLKTTGLLKRLPGVEYGKNEALSVFGSAAAVYVDGVKQRLPANSLYSYLSSLPANVISEIRIMMNPPAKYGNGPVIEIILSRNQKNGTLVEASLFSEYYHKMLGDIGGNLFLISKKGRWTANTMIGYSNTNGFTEKTDSLFWGNNALYNRYQQTGRGSSFNVNTDISVMVADDHRIDFGISAYNVFGQYQTEIETKASFNHEESELMKSKNRDDMYTFVVKYTSPENRLFHVSTYYSGMLGGVRSDNKYTFANSPENNFGSEMAMIGQMHTWAVDMKTDLFGKKINLEYGANAELNIIQDKALYSSVMSAKNTPAFRGREFIPKAYLGLSYHLGGFEFSAKGVVEHAEYLIQEGVAKNQFNKTDFTPRAQISYKSGLYYGLLLFTRSIRHPNYQDLLPGIRYVNDYYYSVGNPNLSPMDIAGFVFLNNIGPVMLRFDYAKARNAYSGIMTTEDNVVYEQQSSFGDMRQYTMYLTVPYRFQDSNISGSFSGDIKIYDYMNLSELVLPLLSRNKVNFAGAFKWTGAWRITNDLSAGMIASYTAPTYSLLVDSKHRTRIDVSMEYSLPHEPLSLSLDIEDLFNSYNRWSKSFSPEVQLVTKRFMYGPTIRLSLLYRFSNGKDVQKDYLDLKPELSRFKQ